jgi:hypothetical protein
MEKVVSVLAAAFVTALLAFLLVSGHHYAPTGIFHNFYAQNCLGEAWYWKVLGDGLFLAGAYTLYLMIADKVDATLGLILLVFALWATAFCALAGFTFPYA